MKSENKKNPPIGGQTLAEFLREKRQEKNLSIEKLSDLTKIQAYHLEALEAGQFEKLPPSIYRTGIFQRLTKYLDIDKNAVIEMYEQETHTTQDTHNKQNIIKPPKNPSFILTQKKLIIFFSVLFLALVSGYLWYQFNFLIGSPNLATDLKDDMITNQDLFTVAGKTDSGINLTINGENVFVNLDGNFSKDIQLADGINTIEISAVNSFGKVTKIIRQVFRNQ
ncbi:MAG: helix-turn-helix domain-containing protein [Candidatus Azambacteria bacterium]|nr:helix-turn-helix domain-containing protein [Candidatus Azambacteria bacterium]